jgi:hypothetical protein
MRRACAGELALVGNLYTCSEESRRTYINAARAEARAIVKERAKDIATLAQVIERLGELDAELGPVIDGDDIIDDDKAPEFETVEHEHHAAAL